MNRAAGRALRSVEKSRSAEQRQNAKREAVRCSLVGFRTSRERREVPDPWISVTFAWSTVLCCLLTRSKTREVKADRRVAGGVSGLPKTPARGPFFFSFHEILVKVTMSFFRDSFEVNFLSDIKSNSTVGKFL